MKISVEQPKGNVRHIVLDGRMDLSGVQAAEAEFNTAVAGSQNIIVDLSKVSFIASLGIRLLVAAAQTRTKNGGKMVLMNPVEMTKKILMTTGIDQLIPICSGLDEALASV